MSVFIDAETLFHRLASLPCGRRLIALAGPPASGKSTLAEALMHRLNDRRTGWCAVVPMDGFHYDDAVLRDMGRYDRKGAPDTYDVDGLESLLRRLRQPGDVAIPVFDRDLEVSRNAARIVPGTADIVIVEGNYLLLDLPPWDRLFQHFERTVMIDLPEAVLRDRLMQRWRHYGMCEDDATRKVRLNDLPNGRIVQDHSRPADWGLRQG